MGRVGRAMLDDELFYTRSGRSSTMPAAGGLGSKLAGNRAGIRCRGKHASDPGHHAQFLGELNNRARLDLAPGIDVMADAGCHGQRAWPLSSQ